MKSKFFAEKGKVFERKNRAFIAISACVMLLIVLLSLSACADGGNDFYVNELANAIINDGTPAIHGIIGDTNVRYTQDTYKTILESDKREGNLSAWKGDRAVGQIAIISENSEIKNATIEVGDFSGENGIIPASNADISFIDETLAYTGLPSGNAPKDTPKGEKDKKNVPDVISGARKTAIPWNSVKGIWVEIYVPESTNAGIYVGEITVGGDGVGKIAFEYTLKVFDLTLPKAADCDFDIEMWQYPYSVAEYYGVEPFGAEHIEILKKHMSLYRDLGGDAITCSIVDDAWGGQTYSEKSVRYPSMVKWTRRADGTFAYDYKDLDIWVTLNKDLGIGNKIVLYSVATWSGQIRFYDERTEKTEILVPTFGSAVWAEMWRNFLTDLISHLESKGWFDSAYMGVDERGFSVATLDLIESVKNSEGKHLKTAGAFNEIANPQKVALANRIDDISVGTKAVKDCPEAFAKLVKFRDKMGKKTTIYTCTTHFPNNLTLSMPGESYWIAMYCAMQNADGYMRWALDAWTKDPLADTTHWNYEAGDCFQIYPGDEANGYTPRMSVRLAKLTEGIRDVNKLLYLKTAMPALDEDISALFSELNLNYTYDINNGVMYADEATKARLPEDMAEIKAAIDKLAEKYLTLTA